MQRFTRPLEPPDFEDVVKDCREEVRKYFASKARNKTVEEGKIEFKAKWKDYKPYFAAAQEGKCGYCEMRVTGGQFGDVEHFYPKGEIWELGVDPKTWGTEETWSSSVKGRERTVLCTQGYWWLAYDWSNYLLSCAICNEAWKLSYFPVKNIPRKTPPHKKLKEHVLLLNPFDETLDPTEHLHFDAIGQIQAKDGSVYGFETIRTCGLDRENLRKDREEKAVRAYFLVGEILKSENSARVSEYLKEIRSMGKEKNNHSGMVRAIFNQYSGVKWEDIDRILGPEV